jgi:hypothetical protein
VLPWLQVQRSGFRPIELHAPALSAAKTLPRDFAVVPRIVRECGACLNFLPMRPDHVDELILNLLRLDPGVTPADAAPLAALARIIYDEMNLHALSVHIALALACEHLADIRSELIEALLRSAR